VNKKRLLSFKNHPELIKQAEIVFDDEYIEEFGSYRFWKDLDYLACSPDRNDWSYVNDLTNSEQKEDYTIVDNLDDFFSANEELYLLYMKHNTKLGNLL
jgi:hypothetical protein